MHPGFAFLLVLMLLGACTDDPATLFEQAKSRRASGDRAGAAVLLKNAIQAQPSDPELRQALAQIHLEMRDASAAEKELRKALELGSKDKGAIAAALAEALWMQGNTAALLSEVVVPQQGSTDPQALIKIHGYRGRAQALRGALADARESLAAAKKVPIQTPSPAVAVLQADILHREGKIAEAIPILDELLKQQPRSYDALLLKADLLRVSKQLDETIAALDALLAIYPMDLNGLVGRSSLLIQTGKWDRAEKDIELLRKQYKEHYITYFQEGLLRFRKGQFRLALELFQATLRRNRNFDLAALYVGMSHIAVGESLQAERVLTIYVRNNPRDRLARQMLASALIDVNEAARAIEVIAPVLEEENPGASFLNLAGEAHFKLGNEQKAEEFFSRAAQRSDAGSAAAERRAIMRLIRGQADAALDDFERIAKARKRVSNADIALIFGYMRKDPAHAMKLIDDLDKKFPGQPFILNLRGVALLKQEQTAAAIASFEEALKKQPAFLPAAANLFKLDVEQGKMEQGRQRFVSVLKADPKHYQALLTLSEVAQSTGRPSEAVDLLKRAIEVHPYEAEPRARLVAILLRQGEKEQALQVAQDFLNRRSKSFDAVELMGKVQLSQGDAHSAVATYTRLVSEYPKSERGHLLLADAQLKANRVSDAERSLRQVLEINPDFREGQLAWVGLMVKEKRADDAKRYAQTLQKERPKSPAGWVLEADIYWAQARFADAAKALSTALSLSPRAEFAVRRYEAQSRADDARNGFAALQQFTEQHPNAVEARVHLAGILQRSGNLAYAAKLYESAASSASVNPLVLTNLAYAYYKLGDARALPVAKQAYRAVPNNPIVMGTFGIILVRDDPKRALDLLEKAVKMQPNQPVFRYHYAQALHKVGDKERAKAELTRLLQKHGNFAERDEAVALLKAIGA